MSRQCCKDGGCGGSEIVDLMGTKGKSLTSHNGVRPDPKLSFIAEEFFGRILAEDVSPSDVFRITTTSFMDAYNFDVRQAMKDCVHFVLPSGHIVPFSVYNLLYRDGLVPLPDLRKAFATEITEGTEKTRQNAKSFSMGARI
jgi:hypothetical protein